MNCRNCSYVYADTMNECPQCGCLKEQEIAKVTSTLIEFPVKNENVTLDWRAEVAAKVRASAANRAAQGGSGAGHRSQTSSRPWHGAGAGTATAMAVDPKPKIDSKAKRDEIVEAALRRLQRAVDSPMPQSPPLARPKGEPKIERKSPSAATALATPASSYKEKKATQPPPPRRQPRFEFVEEPIIERPVSSRVVLPAAPLEPAVAPVIATNIAAPAPVPVVAVVQTAAAPVETQPLPRPSLDEFLEIGVENPPAPEIPHYDYHDEIVSSSTARVNTDAELDKLLHLGATDFDPTASLGQRIIAAVVDAGIILLVTAPFVVSVWVLQVNFSEPRVLYVLGSLATLIGFVYSVLMIGLRGKTAGMSFTGIHVMSLRHSKQPTLFQAAARTLGHLLSAIPLALGFFWIVLGAERRAWHDMLSGTSVVRDY